MARSLAEEAVSRVMQYLAGLGVEPTRDVMSEALALVGEVLDTMPSVGTPDAAAVFGEIMDRLPQRLNLPEPLLPPAVPPLARGSIRYGETE